MAVARGRSPIGPLGTRRTSDRSGTTRRRDQEIVTAAPPRGSTALSTQDFASTLHRRHRQPASAHDMTFNRRAAGFHHVAGFARLDRESYEGMTCAAV